MMKKILKIFFAGAITLVSFSAQAAWQCTVVNPVKNQSWLGVGPTRTIAMDNAIRFCSNESKFARNCNIQGCFQK